MLAEFRSWAPGRATVVSEDAPVPVKRLLRFGCGPFLRLSLRWWSLDVAHARKHEGKGLRVYYHYFYYSLSFHYQHVGRRASFRLLSFHTPPTHRRKSLKLLFYNNFKTIITLCVTNVQRKKIVGIFWGIINLLMICSYLIVGFSLSLYCSRCIFFFFSVRKKLIFFVVVSE